MIKSSEKIIKGGILMSGHSKWNNIKNKKEKSDAQRGKIFTKLGREILVAVKEGGPDPAGNSKLRDVIAKCKANNMPNDNIERSIKKAAGDGNSANYEEITYEGYGPNGVAVMIEAMTDNRNRTAGDVRHLFDKYGAGLGTTNSVAYMFDVKGVFVVSKESQINEDELMEKALYRNRLLQRGAKRLAGYIKSKCCNGGSQAGAG